MIKVSHTTLYGISGAIWMLIGIMLLNMGLGFLMHGFEGQTFSSDGYSGLFTFVSSLTPSPDNAAIILVVLSILIGFVKGRLVLQKAALKSYDRISQLESPTSLSNLYTRSNLIIIAFMMLLGMTLGRIGTPFDLRGMIDTAVGCALMQGALAYFQLMGRAKAKA